MTSAKLNFDGVDAGPLEQGATFTKKLLINIDGLDLSTVTDARMQVRTDFSKRLILELTVDNGRITLVNGEGVNYIQLFVSAADTAILLTGEFVYDLKLTTADKTIRLLEGEFTITPAVTVV